MTLRASDNTCRQTGTQRRSRRRTQNIDDVQSVTLYTHILSYPLDKFGLDRHHFQDKVKNESHGRR